MNVRLEQLTASQKVANVQASGINTENKNVQTFRNQTDGTADQVCFNPTNTIANTIANNITVFNGNKVVLAQLKQYAAQKNLPNEPGIGSAARNALGNLFRPEEESTMSLADAC